MSCSWNCALAQLTTHWSFHCFAAFRSRLASRLCKCLRIISIELYRSEHAINRIIQWQPAWKCTTSNNVAVAFHSYFWRWWWCVCVFFFLFAYIHSKACRKIRQRGEKKRWQRLKWFAVMCFILIRLAECKWIWSNTTKCYEISIKTHVNHKFVWFMFLLTITVLLPFNWDENGQFVLLIAYFGWSNQMFNSS